jgi:hypothetical protein
MRDIGRPCRTRWVAGSPLGDRVWCAGVESLRLPLPLPSPAAQWLRDRLCLALSLRAITPTACSRCLASLAPVSRTTVCRSG